MAIEKVKAYFEALGRGQDVLEFETSSATVELAAQAVGVVPARIAKTLSFKQGEGCVLIVAAGDARIDNRKFKDAFGMKAKMLTPEETVLDCSLKRFESVYPACGSSNSAIELTCEELFSYAKATRWVDVCKDWAE